MPSFKSSYFPAHILINLGEKYADKSDIYPEDVYHVRDSIKFVKNNQGTRFSSLYQKYPNKIIKGIRIIDNRNNDLGFSGQFLAIADNRVVYISEDLVNDCIANVGISKGGYIDAEFTWILDNKLDHTVQLIRIGSKDYLSAKEFLQRSKIKKIPINKLKVGGIYEQPNGTQEIFLGFFNTIQQLPKNYQVDETRQVFKKKMNAPLFLYWHEDWTMADFKIELTEDEDSYHFEKDHHYIKKVGQHKITDKLINFYKDLKLSKIKKRICDPRIPLHSIMIVLEYDSQIINLVPTNVIPTTFNIKKYLILR